jgi:flavodoxin/formate hydrogenlyase subunit 6/NADH:ubiquinone oxidoreductase subunit I
MKCVVIYFSQTGNTEKIAKAVHAGVQKAAGNCNLVKIKDADPHRLQQYDLIGIGTPVFGYGPAMNIRAFIKDMKFVGSKHVFAFATHGTHGEYFASAIAPMLKRRGMVVLGVRDWYGDCFIPGAPNPYPTHGHPDEIDCEEAETWGRELVSLSQKISAGESNLIPPMPKAPKVPLKKMLDDVRRVEEERGAVFEHSQTPAQYDREKCLYPKCQLCMDNCPLDGIDLTVEPPVIAQPCMHCMFCAKICPTGAMAGDFFYDTPSEKTWKSVPEFHLDVLVKAEAEGKFRRLVPVDKIGLDNPYYKTHNKHPWWIIGKGLQ